MILKSNDKQFKLTDDGQITWQRDETNPLPGVPVAHVRKGDTPFTPQIELIDDAAPLAGVNKDEAKSTVQEWLGRHLKAVLEPLFNLKQDDIVEGAPRDIAGRLYDGFGILPRADLEDLIAQMDEEKRACLRTKKIRFGPLLVFLPELNKPAAVRLRAMLLSLSQDKPLPADVPADGIVSFSVKDKDVDADYYRAIGYPVYGPRSVRVDMLDRVICAVYDSADKGEFQAQHKMAEWLGSNIPDLYEVLEAMGHTKIKDPAADAEKENEEQEKTEQKEQVDSKISEETSTSGQSAETTTEESAAPEQKTEAEVVKPELATFRLKRGKAIDTKRNNNKFSNKNSGFSSSDKNKQDKKKFKPKAKKKPHSKEARERVFVAEAKTDPADNPFAVLEQLKTAQKDS